MWSADKLIYRNEDDFTRAYQGSVLVWVKPTSNNRIFYTSTNGQVVTPYSNNFGVNIVSNTYSGGVGVIEFDGDVTKIGTYAFYNRNTLQTIVIPDSVTSIQSYAFQGTSLTSIHIPANVRTIYADAFTSACTNVTSITVDPNNPYYADLGSNGIFDIPHNMLRYGCRYTTIPSGIKEISSEAFLDVIDLQSIVLPNTIEYIREFAFDNTGLMTINIPNSVKQIRASAFKNCSNLETVHIGNGVKLIKRDAFRNCNILREVVIDAVTPPDCDDLVQPANTWKAFDNNAVGRKIKVPSSSLTAYRTATGYQAGWADYASDIISQ